MACQQCFRRFAGDVVDAVDGAGLMLMSVNSFVLLLLLNIYKRLSELGL